MTRSTILQRCSLCGEPLAQDPRCSICLEPRAEARPSFLGRSRWWLRLSLFMLFVATSAALLRVSVRIADPMTHVSLHAVQSPFPIILISRGSHSDLLLINDIDNPPPAPAGCSYLIPSGDEQAVVDSLNRRLPHEAEGTWVVRVERPAAGRQRMELYYMADGYSGGVYDATERSVRPLYRKITGPGFAFVFGGLALLLNSGVWFIGYVVNAYIRRLRRRAEQRF